MSRGKSSTFVATRWLRPSRVEKDGASSIESDQWPHSVVKDGQRGGRKLRPISD